MKNARGFTLIELMVTLGVLAVLVSIAAPSFNTMIQNNRMTTRANDLVTALNLARSEAIRRGANITVCASSDATTCTGTWGQGWVILEGANVLRVFPALAGTITLAETSTAASVVYQARGMVSAARTFNVCDSARSGETGRQIDVSAAGRVSVSPFTCS